MKKNTKSQYGKMLDQKKIGRSTSTQTWVDMKRPNRWKNNFQITQKCEKKILSPKIENIGQKKGYPASTQTRKDTKCQTAKKHNINFAKKLELPKKNHSPIGFSSGWYGGKRIHRRPNDFIIVSALYLMPVFRQYFLAASI